MTDDPLCPACSKPNPFMIEFPEIYDGGLIWQCEACKHMWPRFSAGRHFDQALDVIGKWGKK